VLLNLCMTLERITRDEGSHIWNEDDCEEWRSSVVYRRNKPGANNHNITSITIQL